MILLNKDRNVESKYKLTTCIVDSARGFILAIVSKTNIDCKTKFTETSMSLLHFHVSTRAQYHKIFQSLRVLLSNKTRDVVLSSMMTQH